MSIAVFGCGYVGMTTALTFCELEHDVVCVDADKQKIELLQKGQMPFFEPGMKEMLNRHLQEGNIRFTQEAEEAIKASEIIYIAVGTPSDDDGSTDLSFVEDVARTIGRYQGADILAVIKSTVPVGTAEKVERWIRESQRHPYQVDVVSNPEFLREGNALYDALHPDRIIIGAQSKEAAKIVHQLYAGLDAPVIHMSVRSAELTKYSANAFLALKISFINEIGRLCDAYGVQVEDVAQGMGTDQRIGPHFLRAGIGWGGSCFPKDTASLVHMCRRAGLKPKILEAAREVNATQIAYYLQKLKEMLGGLKGKTVSILGVTFKPNTDDIRDSPALAVIHALHDQGASVNVYDPIALHRVNVELPRVHKCVQKERLFAQSDAVFLLTDWDEFTHLDWQAIYGQMRTPLVIDGRNALDAPKLRHIGFTYYGIGRSHHDGNCPKDEKA